MARLQGNSPEQVFRKFKKHLDDLLHKTVTQAPLQLVIVESTKALVQFGSSDGPSCVQVGRRYHLFLGQTLQALRDGEQYRLRTLAYAYRISEGPSFSDPCIFRWEYNSRERRESLSPRHHFHTPVILRCFGTRDLNLNQLHIASGWVTVEEIIRFLIAELNIKPKSRDWDRLLRDSEEKFREWTARSV